MERLPPANVGWQRLAGVHAERAELARSLEGRMRLARGGTAVVFCCLEPTP